MTVGTSCLGAKRVPFPISLNIPLPAVRRQVVLTLRAAGSAAQNFKESLSVAQKVLGKWRVLQGPRVGVRPQYSKRGVVDDS